MKKIVKTNNAIDMFKGNLANIPRNIILGGNFENNSLSQEYCHWLTVSLLFGALVYPINTVQRR